MGSAGTVQLERVGHAQGRCSIIASFKQSEYAADFVLLSPRQQLTPTPYARYAPSAGEAAMALAVPNGAITDLKIAADAVKSVHLAPGSVNSDKIADGSITSSFLTLPFARSRNNLLDEFAKTGLS